MAVQWDDDDTAAVEAQQPPPPPRSRSKLNHTLPLVALVAALILFLQFSTTTNSHHYSSSPSKFSLHRQDRLPTSRNRTAAWQDYRRIKALTRPAGSHVLAPKHLSHLANSHSIDKSHSAVWILSAYLDTRPLVVGGAPEVAVLGGGGEDLMKDGLGAQEAFWCFFATKGGKYGQSKAYVRWLPDSHPELKKYVPAMWTCGMEWAVEAGVVWEDEDIFVSVSPLSLPPLPSSFLPVQHLPPMPSTHASGHGTATMCVQPLVSDTYATTLGHWVDHYTALGFTKFQFYLLDPGPVTLGVLEDLGSAYPASGGNGKGNETEIEVELFRWALPKAWLTKVGEHLVDPRDWGLEDAGLHAMSNEEEAMYGFPGVEKNSKDYVEIWAFAQNLALHDCRYRAMTRSSRWVAHFDLDEYLLIRPPSGVWPPPPTTPSPFTNWALTTAADATLPTAFTFQSAFTCVSCRPTTEPVKTEAVRELEEMGGKMTRPSPGWPAIYASPVRTDWFGGWFRAKTVVDPWAWYMTNFHWTEIPYSDYAKGRCASWTTSPSTPSTPSSVTSCISSFASLFPNPVRTPTTPWPALYNSSKAIVPSSRGVGAMYHLRADRAVLNARTEWATQAAEEGSDYLFNSTGYDQHLSKVQILKPDWRSKWLPKLPEGTPGELVEDWTMVNTFGNVLVHVLKERQERPDLSWTGKRWHGGRSVRREPKGAMQWAWILPLGGAVGVVGVARWRAGRRRSGDGGVAASWKSMELSM
ncbi:hypothetical protein MNV49_004106 [Pseudohyphozyma bogoriensis]|nr:hypothetical protein MNV49_004106 [Pseudohyphozyma bogoriensis]